ncbi:Fatty acid reductase 4 [Hibiscus syriacus]|uniref:Fatty acyl-CoA reductase n=1 Tax=Hibiscus syriacus TaxID=106335 RepID=A0A6A2ZLY7_HIBSY|nr:Fatty acid reductase 4 [Hibiscus syriacus]
MEMGNVSKFLRGKTILITGATGFLAKSTVLTLPLISKPMAILPRAQLILDDLMFQPLLLVFLEKILRLQPNVNKLYLLLRASDDKSAPQRLHDEIISTKLFRVLGDKWSWEFDNLMSSKVIAVAGDISWQNLGIGKIEWVAKYIRIYKGNGRDAFRELQRGCASCYFTSHHGYKTVDRIVVSYGKGKLPFFFSDLNSPLDVIPVDMVVNAMAVAMEVHYADRQCSRETIYHISSSSGNPMKLSDFHRFLHCYFTKNPWIDTNGKIVKVSKGTVFSTPHRFFLFMKLKYVLPLKVCCS